jgi:hypothetical protein
MAANTESNTECMESRNSLINDVEPRKALETDTHKSSVRSCSNDENRTVTNSMVATCCPPCTGCNLLVPAHDERISDSSERSAKPIHRSVHWSPDVVDHGVMTVMPMLSSHMEETRISNEISTLSIEDENKYDSSSIDRNIMVMKKRMARMERLIQISVRKELRVLIKAKNMRNLRLRLVQEYRRHQWHLLHHLSREM